MKQYIDKSALVAEIERRLSLLENGTGDSEVMKRVEGVIKGYKSILSFLNTLEVKEVDIRSEVSDWWNNHYTGAKKDYTFEGYSGHYMENSTIISLAQYFFNLGLKAQKG